MDTKITAMERAFQLARSGRSPTVSVIIKSLRREGYAAEQIHGPSLRRQLTTLIKAARPKAKERHRPDLEAKSAPTT